MDELQAGVELSLAVFPQSPILFQPRKTAFNNPAFGHHLERVQFAAPGNLHRDLLTQNGAHALGERRSGIAAVAQHSRDLRQIRGAALKRVQRTLAIRNLRRRHRHGVRQALRIDRNVPLDA